MPPYSSFLSSNRRSCRRTARPRSPWPVQRAAFLLAALIPSAFWCTEAKADLPHIRILATGGTIAGKQPDANSAGYVAGTFSVEDLIRDVPKLQELAVISGEQVANIGSQDMNDAVWLKLADRLNATLQDPKISGVVITHGTDTMEETGYFLNLVTPSDKPIVMVGSMRPATSMSADGPMNLYNAVAVAADPKAGGRGVLVVMNDEIFSAREAQKTNTTRLDTFQAPNRGLEGSVNLGKVVLFAPPVPRHTKQGEFSVTGLTSFPQVDIIYAHAGMGRRLIDAAVKSGTKGIVLAGVGDGNATTEALDALEEAAKQGVIVVRSSRVGSGSVVRNMEVNDDQRGFITAMELSPSKARILLMLGLTRTQDRAKLQGYFTEY